MQMMPVLLQQLVKENWMEGCDKSEDPDLVVHLRELNFNNSDK